MSQYIVGLDLGQAQDYTALCVLERIKQTKQVPNRLSRDLPPVTVPDGPGHYHCGHLQRFPLGTRYPAIVEGVKALLDKPELKGQATLVIDASGVGRPVCDLFQQAGIPYTGVTITGGDSVTHDGNMKRVPKRILVSTLQVLLQAERLKVAPNELRETLVREMLAFQVTISEAANDTYSGRSGTHDDIVLAIALAAWLGECGMAPPLAPLPKSRNRRY